MVQSRGITMPYALAESHQPPFGEHKLCMYTPISSPDQWLCTDTSNASMNVKTLYIRCDLTRIVKIQLHLLGSPADWPATPFHALPAHKIVRRGGGLIKTGMAPVSRCGCIAGSIPLRTRPQGWPPHSVLAWLHGAHIHDPALCSSNIEPE